MAFLSAASAPGEFTGALGANIALGQRARDRRQQLRLAEPNIARRMTNFGGGFTPQWDALFQALTERDAEVGGQVGNDPGRDPFRHETAEQRITTGQMGLDAPRLATSPRYDAMNALARQGSFAPLLRELARQAGMR